MLCFHFCVSVCVSVCLSVCVSVRTWLQCSTRNTFKATDFKFDKHVHRDSPDMTPQKSFEKGAWPGSRDSLNYWALYANCWNMVKGKNFKFERHVPRESPDMTSQKNFEKGACPGSREPPQLQIHLADICTLWAPSSYWLLNFMNCRRQWMVLLTFLHRALL